MMWNLKHQETSANLISTANNKYKLRYKAELFQGDTETVHTPTNSHTLARSFALNKGNVTPKIAA